MLELTNKEKCCGCTACQAGCPTKAIYMQRDKEGFSYPFFQISACIDCGICEKICPFINPSKTSEPFKVYSAKNKNEFKRFHSSSGGVFIALAEKIIADNGVVFGATFNNDWEVVHNYTSQYDKLKEFQKSKYVQSNTGNTYQQVKSFLKEGTKVLFTGTPCQVAGLKSYLGKEYQNLVTMDFICHGVPSPVVFKLYINAIVESINDEEHTDSINKHYTINNIDFRDKRNGWSNFHFTITFTDKKNPENKDYIFSESLEENLFLKGFLSNLYLRPSCYSCKCKNFTSGSDITIGDFWGISNYFPEINDDKGISTIIVNNPKIRLSDLNLTLNETNLKDILPGNSALVYSVQKHLKRELFFKNIDSFSLQYLSSFLKPTIQKQLKSTLREILIKTSLISFYRKVRYGK